MPLAVDAFLCGFVGRDCLIPAPLLCLNIAFKWRVRIVIRIERALRIREPILQIPNDGRDCAQFAPVCVSEFAALRTKTWIENVALIQRAPKIEDRLSHIGQRWRKRLFPVL